MPSRRLVLLALAALILVFHPRPAHMTGRVTLAFLGDVMLGRGVARAHTPADWPDALRAIASQAIQADLTLANLESPITQAPLVRETYDLRAAAIGLTALTSARVDVVTLANNHAYDAGQPGLEDTRRALRSSGIQAVGPELVPAFFIVNGVRLAILALDDSIASIDETRAVQTITPMDQAGYIVIVSIHWGNEFQSGPSARQKRLAQTLADAGADVIVGHHPHVLQRIAWLTSRLDTHPTLVAYSLGNALFDQPDPLTARQSALLLVTIDGGRVSTVSAIPVMIDVRAGKIIAATGDQAAAIFDQLHFEK